MARWWCALIAAAAVCSCSASALSAQSLGDVAKKEQQRRKTARSTGGKVYTNKDLGPAGTAPAPAAAPAPAPATQTAGPGGTEPSASAENKGQDPRKTEEYWRKRIEAARAEIQRNELFLDALQTRINALSMDFVNRDDPAQRAVIANDRDKALAEMTRVKDSLAALKKQVDDIEEEARQAGVPPGWLR